MKVAVFGASVSEQRVNHKTKEVTGYVQMLRDRHQAAMGVGEIRQIVYAGNRLSDGGLARLPEVEAYAPDICIFEPLIEDSRRGARPSEAEYRLVYRRLVAKGILPITLMLPIPKVRKASKSADYQKISGICRSYDLPIIDVTIPDDVDLEAGFNGVHTRSPGAALYAEQVHAGLMPFLDSARRQDIIAKAHPKTVASRVPAFMRTLGSPTGMAPKIRGVEMELTLGPAPNARENGPARSQCKLRLVQQHRIGTFSPVILTKAVSRSTGTLADEVSVSVWDDFCHFTRTSFMTSGDLTLPVDASYRISLGIIDKDPDYASCRRGQMDWPAANARQLQPTGPLFVISDTPFEARILRCDPA